MRNEEFPSQKVSLIKIKTVSVLTNFVCPSPSDSGAESGKMVCRD